MQKHIAGGAADDNLVKASVRALRSRGHSKRVGRTAARSVLDAYKNDPKCSYTEETGVIREARRAQLMK